MNIVVKKLNEDTNNIYFLVLADAVRFEVTLARNDWKKLAARFESEEALVRQSFEFLLTKEPKEAILKKFDLMDIEKYFPDYHSTVLYT